MPVGAATIYAHARKVALQTNSLKPQEPVLGGPNRLRLSEFPGQREQRVGCGIPLGQE